MITLKKMLFLAFISAFSQWEADAQNIKIDNTALFSSFNNTLGLPILLNNTNTYSVNLGIDYLEHKWFYLSSQVGYMRIGGSEESSLISGEFKSVKETGDYLHMNTSFRAFKEVSRISVFAGVGPYMNILIGSRDFGGIYRDFYEYKKQHIGVKGEIGFSYDIKRLRVGLVGNYLKSFNEIGFSSDLKLTNTAFGVAISTGYILK